MILLFNVKITSQGLTRYDRGAWLPNYDRMDIFKYCLASYTAMLPLISKCEFYIELAPEFADRQEELEQYIKELYPEDKLNLNWYRHFYTSDWRNWCDNVLADESELIWFAGNDDHIFIDYNLDVLDAGLKLLQEDPDPYAQLYYSHWAEQVKVSYAQGGTLTEDKNYVVRPWRIFDAITVLKSERWKSYWFDQDWGQTPVWRTDVFFHLPEYQLQGPVYSPTRELVRHYDGYSHVGYLANSTPPLFIPPGFFEKDMKIKIGFDTRDDNYTNFHPAASILYTADPSGMDYRWITDDIPMFWRDRISEVIYAPDYDHDFMVRARDAAYLASTRTPINAFGLNLNHNDSAPKEWFLHNFRGSVDN